MKRYTLNRLYLENFKLIESNKPQLIDFSQYAENLIILSGPNGFGKTTIFDALEIVFTNNISRIQNITDGRTKQVDNLLSNDSNKDVIIKAEFKKEDEYLTIVKRIAHDTENNNEINLKENIETYFFNSKLELANNFEDVSYNEDFVSKINKYLGIDSKHFNIFNYISQEETTHYLKKGERDRHKIFDTLFDIEYLNERINRFKSIKKTIENRENTLKEEILKYHKYINASNHIYQEETEEYIKLILFKDKDIYWDMEKPKIISESQIDVIDDIEKFIEYYGEFKNDLFNQEIEVYTQDESLISDFIYLRGIDYINSFYDIDIIYKKYNTTLNFYNNINEEKIVENFTIEDFLKISDELNYDMDIDYIKQKIVLINSYKDLQSENNKLVNNFNNTRLKLKQEFDKLLIDEIEPNKCPLCNSIFKSKEDLISSIDIQTSNIKKLLDCSTDRLNEEIKKLNNYVEPFRKMIKNYLDNMRDKVIDEQLFNKIKTAYRNKDNVIKLYNFLDKNKCLNKIVEEIDENNIENSLSIILGILNELHIPLSPDYKFFKEKCNFDIIYSDILFENEFNINYILLNRDLIAKKREYLKYRYLTHKISEEIKLREEYVNCKNELINIRKLKNNIIDIINIYDCKINMFKYDMIPVIEIPLFLYTGKIIQNHQRGLGVFIDNGSKDKKNIEENQLKKIKFVPNMRTKHDIINSFSSGQLAGFIIAFTMVMNKIYSKDDLNMILIDDPVQTMDEINVSSLVEVLRNEFTDTQIILSTHEPRVSNYIRYKFLKYGIKSLDYNVKNNFNL